MDQSTPKQTTLQYRYPGTRPFTADDRNLFFGRDEDIGNLSQFCSLESLIVLYGKSGLGKTSLLNAGVVPRLCETENYEAIDVRFGAYLPENDTRPTEILRQKISEKISFDNFLWKKVLNLPNGEDFSTVAETGNSKIPEDLWYYFKGLQIQKGEREAFLIVFDQFEELFTYPDTSITLFAKELSSLLNVRAPQYIRNTVKERLKAGDDFISREEMALLYKPLNIKVVISIRSDRMSLLNLLKDYLPDILKKTYELKPLEITQAKDAILLPATKEGSFASPAFAYDAGALNDMLGYLSKGGKQRVESFQLQLLCQFAEKVVMDAIKNNQEKGRLTRDDFGEFDTIFKRHYDSLIGEIKDNSGRNAAQKLIEDHLIVEGNRVALPEIVITSRHNIPPAILQQLVNSRLLRAEPNTTGGFSYEISHDTLVIPILEARRLRLEIEEKERAEQERREELQKMREKQRRQRTIIVIVAVAAIVSIGLAIYGFWQKHKAQTLADKSLALLKTSMPAGTTNVYAYFRECVIESYKDGAYANAITHLNSANLSPDMPSANDLAEWKDKIDRCQRLGQQADKELEKGNFTGAQETCEQILVINKDSKSDACRLSLCKLFIEQLILVRGGSFIMGSKDGEPDEKPHKVLLDGFYISKYEVTNAQYAHFLNQYGSDKVKSGDYAGQQMVDTHTWGIRLQGKIWLPQPGYEDHPVVSVSWYGAYEFCRFYGGNLPTEAQWEYAARRRGRNQEWAGTSDEKVLGKYAWYFDNSDSHTHPVGTRKPNGLGIYDMSGNVWEWCYDWYGNYPNIEQKNPAGLSGGSRRVVRGGGWNGLASHCRATNRIYDSPDVRYNGLGFRFARTVNF
ncbi:MAG: hypothetical protein B6D35_07610 [Candidatus Brocadia sp. UTAMX2]|jgi:formylglycine-generating enzyme required for sulfatase activity|nr:MAG: hypothetical protein B6D35_07610 [Candidatus Brocadia sp. UTAMX2]